MSFGYAVWLRASSACAKTLQYSASQFVRAIPSAVFPPEMHVTLACDLPTAQDASEAASRALSLMRGTCAVTTVGNVSIAVGDGSRIGSLEARFCDKTVHAMAEAAQFDDVGQRVVRGHAHCGKECLHVSLLYHDLARHQLAPQETTISRMVYPRLPKELVFDRVEVWDLTSPNVESWARVS